MEKTKEEIIETLGLHLEKEHNLPPLAARIYAILILTDEDGITFEDCLEKRGASKSSTSTSLNLLLNMGLVTYFTKPSDRRRYFTTAKKKNFFLLQDGLMILNPSFRLMDKHSILHPIDHWMERQKRGTIIYGYQKRIIPIGVSP